MPSPFPGMDPYLESHEWTSVHYELSSQIARQLVPQVSPRYTVRTVERFVTTILDDGEIKKSSIYPDVGVAETKTRYEIGRQQFYTPSLPLQLITIMPSKVPHVTVEIRTVGERELITAIEVISPTNKQGRGYREYLDKRDNILTSMVHLVEIDLLRVGRRVPMKSPLPDAPYFIFLSRAEKRPITDVWPIPFEMPLPTIPIPLLAEDADAILDLQLVLNTVYDDMRYDLTVNYHEPPEITLEGETAVWATNLLQQAGYSHEK